MTARIVTALIGVIVTPIALGITSSSGIQIYQLQGLLMYQEFDPAALAGPIAMQILGLVLLLGVIATGLWSSAGLLAAGVLGLATIIFAVVPGLLLELYMSAPRFIPSDWIDGLFYGVPLVVYTVLGAMGLALFMIRRSTRRASTGLVVGGFIAAPVLLAIGGSLLVWGGNEGQNRAVITMDGSINPIAAGAVIAGVVFTIAGIAAARWSPWALVIPAAGLLLLTLLFFLSISAPDLRSLIPFELFRVGMSFVLMGGALITGIAQLGFTVVAVLVSRRARRKAASAGGAYPSGPFPAGQYPRPSAAPYSPGQHPAPSQTGYPPVPPTS